MEENIQEAQNHQNVTDDVPRTHIVDKIMDEEDVSDDSSTDDDDENNMIVEQSERSLTALKAGAGIGGGSVTGRRDTVNEFTNKNLKKVLESHNMSTSGKK